MGITPAMHGETVTVGSNTLTLPADWQVVDCQDSAAPERPVSVTDVKSSTLLLAAHPSDSARRVGISLFRTNFRTTMMMPPTHLSGGINGGGGTVSVGIGEQSEAEKLLCTVLALGFTPTAIQTSRSNSSQNTPLLTVEITAKNAAGEERVFTNTAASDKFQVVRLFSSRQATDQTAAQEITAIIRSIGIGVSGGSTPAVTTSPSSPSAPVEVSAQTSQMVADYTDALLMVEGQHGVGSGFLCTSGTSTFAITNAHVLSGNAGFKFTNLKSAVINVGAGAISVDHDIVKLEVPSGGKTFQLMENLDTNVKIGDAVVVLGNAQGARVVKPVEGKVVGVGPNLVEVDAPFVPGNSGSPIVHQASGKVLGVATYLIERKVSKGGGEPVTIETRRFGYRLDSVKTWEPINWQRFFAQSAQAEKIETLSNDFIQLFKDSHQKGGLANGSYQSPVIQRSVQTFVNTIRQRGKTMSPTDRNTLLTRFFAELRVASRGDITTFDSRNAYDYFRREVEKQTRFRESIYNDLTRAIEEKAF